MIDTGSGTSINPMHVFDVKHPVLSEEENVWQVNRVWQVWITTSFGESRCYEFSDKTAAITFHNLVAKFSPFSS